MQCISPGTSKQLLPAPCLHKQNGELVLILAVFKINAESRIFHARLIYIDRVSNCIKCRNHLKLPGQEYTITTLRAHLSESYP